MKFLVTGATGFIGSHVVDKLIERGYDARATIRKTSNLRWLQDKPVELVEASLSDSESLKKAVEGIDYIIHIAGLTAAKNLEGYMRGNRDGTRNLVEAAVNYAPNLKKFVFVSSQTAVGPSKSLNEPIDENTPCSPITSYGKSKRAAEEEVLKVKDKMPVTVLRPPAVFGPRDTATFDVFKMVNMGLAVLIGFKSKYLSLIHSEDLSRGIVEATESDKTNGDIYFISSEEFYSWDQFHHSIKEGLERERVFTMKIPNTVVLSVAGLSGFFGKFSSKPPVFNYEKGLDFIQDYWICSVEKAKRDFGYEQKISLEDGLRQTAQWYKDNGWL